jgi:hypothetical protein
VSDKPKFTRERPKTVGELIQELQKFPVTARIMVCGSEDSLHDCGRPVMTLVMLNRNPDDKPHLGPHLEAGDGSTDKAVGAVVIADAGREF